MTTTAETSLRARRVRSSAVHEAWQVTEDTIGELAAMLRGTITVDHTSAPYVRTLLHVGGAVAELGDWVLRDEYGEITTVWDATFQTRYRNEVVVQVQLDEKRVNELIVSAQTKLVEQMTEAFE